MDGHLWVGTNGLTGADRLLAGEKGVFALCRPPGHHAAADVFGGYCFFNNAAIAAQHLRDKGCSRVAVLDVDYHHGNGTQSIFYDRADVLFASIHATRGQSFRFTSGLPMKEERAPGWVSTIIFRCRPGAMCLRGWAHWPTHAG